MAVEYMTKSLRIPEAIVKDLEKIMAIRNLNFTDLVNDILIQFVKEENDNFAIAEEFEKENTEYMYIPAKYYAQYNNISMLELDIMVNQGKLTAFRLGTLTLIAIKTSDKIYNKMELFILRDTINTLSKKVDVLQKRK